MRHCIRVAVVLSITLLGAGANLAQAFHGHLCVAKHRGYAGFQSYGYMPMYGGYPSNIRMCYPGTSAAYMGGCSMGGCYDGGCGGGGCYEGYGAGACGAGGRGRMGGGKVHGAGRLARMCGCLHKGGSGCGGWMSGCNGCFAGAFGCGDGYGSGCGGGCGTGGWGNGGWGNGGCDNGGCGTGGWGCGDGGCSPGGGMMQGEGVIYEGQSMPVESMQAPIPEGPSASLGRSPFHLTGMPGRRDGSAAFDRGLSRFRAGTLSDALGDFEAAASAEPDNAMYHYYRALAMYDLHGADAAQDALAQAVAVEKDRPIANWGKKMERVQGRNRLWVEKARREAGLVR